MKYLSRILMLINGIIRYPSGLIRRWSISRNLRAIKNIDEFNSYIDRVQPESFLFYKNVSESKRQEFFEFLSSTGIEIKDQKVLEIGPGYGDVLDICYEKGAERIDFIDLDPYFFTYNRVKGFTRGYQVDFRNSLGKLSANRYNFIWGKGFLSADSIIRWNRPGKWWLSILLARLERLAEPEYQIIITPHWEIDQQTHQRHISDISSTSFYQTMLEHGYTVLPKVKLLNDGANYPITFSKSSSD